MSQYPRSEFYSSIHKGGLRVRYLQSPTMNNLRAEFVEIYEEIEELLPLLG